MDREDFEQVEGPDFRGDELDEDRVVSDSGQPEKIVKKRQKNRRRFMFSLGMAAIFVVLTTPIALMLFRYEEKSRPVRTEVIAPVPSQNYVSRLTFYVLAQSKEKEDFIRLDVTFGFASLNGKECFERNEILYKDMAYRFLKKQRPEKNAQSQWSRIIEGPLLEHLNKEKVPCSVKSVYLEMLQRV